ncbi:MAG: hypothetical protein U1D55_19620 [Phycisphaerae bacterium]
MILRHDSRSGIARFQGANGTRRASSRFSRKLLAYAVVIGALSPAVRAVAQSTFVEGFESGNEGGWLYGSPFGGIQIVGGNPGACFRDPQIDTFAPQPHTTQHPSEFTGDYRARHVTSVGIDLILFYVDFSAGGRPLSVILETDNGTPGNFSDDWGAFLIGPAIVPQLGEGWRRYDFAIPSDAPSLPAGWEFIQFGPGSPTPIWNTLLHNVTRLRFFYGDPRNFFIFQVWDVAMDNPRITYNPAQPGDLNGDNCVNESDLGLLLAAWQSGAGGDVDGDGDTDESDLGLLLANWRLGC